MELGDDISVFQFVEWQRTSNYKGDHLVISHSAQFLSKNRKTRIINKSQRPSVLYEGLISYFLISAIKIIGKYLLKLSGNA